MTRLRLSGMWTEGGCDARLAIAFALLISCCASHKPSSSIEKTSSTNPEKPVFAAKTIAKQKLDAATTCPLSFARARMFRVESYGEWNEPAKISFSNGKNVEYAWISWLSFNNDGLRDAVLLFARKDKQRKLEPDCDRYGRCRQTIVSGCNDSVLIESFPEGRFGPLIPDTEGRHMDGVFWYSICEQTLPHEGGSKICRLWQRDGVEYVAAKRQLKSDGIEDELHWWQRILPAISEDGRRVAVVESQTDYDNTGWTRMRVIRINDNSVLREFELSSYDEQGGKEDKVAEEKAMQLLKRGRFVSMSPPLIDPLGTMLSDSPGVSHGWHHDSMTSAFGRGYRVSYDWEKGRVVVDSEKGQWSIVVPSLLLSPDCCAFVDEERHTKKCMFVPLLQRVWLDSEKDVVLLKLASSAGRDGCEIAPYYYVARVGVFSLLLPTNS